MERMQKFLPVLLFVLTLVLAAGAFLSYGSYNPDKFPVAEQQPYITPAVYTFMIWAVIYIWLAFATFMLWRKHAKDDVWSAMRLPLIISIFAGVFWGPSSSINGFLSLLIIIVMLGGAVLALQKTPETDPWIGVYPIGLYAGWLSAAVGVSSGTLLFNAQILADPVASVVGLAVSGIVSLLVIARISSVITYTVAVVWGLVGVVVHNVGESGSTTVLIIAALGALLVGGFGIMTKIKSTD